MIVGDVERWQQISPLLDGLLDLPPERRAERLAALRAEDPALAAELEALIGHGARADASHFLAGSAPLPDAAGRAMQSLAGTRLGAYVLEAPLGQGGTGAVWRARRADGRFEGHVAVKLLHLSLIGRTGALRFEREGAILARLSHPHIAHLLDAGISDGGQPYLVIELVAGERIDLHCDLERLSVAQRVALFRAVLEAVAHAHRHLVIHRDIKPSNILVGADGSVKLLDFGIAKLLDRDEAGASDLTAERGGALTPDYAAPEQLRGEPVTTATDVYSLGVLLFQLLAGRHPTAPPRASPADLMRTTLETPPGPLAAALLPGKGASPADATRLAAERDSSVVRLRRQLGGDLDLVVAKALRKAPAERYATVDAFGEDLRRWAAAEPVSARPDSLAYRASRFVARHRGAVAAGVLTFAAILAGLVGTIDGARRAEQQRLLATRAAEQARIERDQALLQQKLQRGTNEFLQLLMRDAAGGDSGAIRKQLDRAVALLEQTRFEAPIVKVALLRQIAGRYAELGEYAAAIRLLREAIAAVAGTDLAAPTSAVPVNLACSLARDLHETGDERGALVELDRADRLVAAGAGLSVPSRAECRAGRSFVATALGDYGRGVSLLREAMQELASAGIREGEQVRVLRGSLARALKEAGDHAGAMAIATPLLAENTVAQGRESMAVLRRSSVVTSLARLGGDPLAALDHSQADRDAAAHLLGPGRVDAAIELEHGLILLELARFDAAATVLARASSAAEAAQQAPLALDARLAEVEALSRGGHAAEATARFAALGAALASAAPPERVESLRIDALLVASRGDSAAARRDLADAEQQLGAGADGTVDTPPHPKACAFVLARGELAAAGRDDDALALAERALTLARRRALLADRSSDVGRALLLRARALAAAGRGVESRRDAEAARAQLEPTLGAAHPATRAAAALAATTPSS